QLLDIARIQVRFLQSRLAARDLGFEVTEAALAKLSEAGFDPVYGARPLKRTIQVQLENPLAQEILAGRFEPGEAIMVDVAGGKFVFSNRAAASTQVA
ncbi:MAG: hypothetical protein QF565_02030, partial [Arenicellales bacterium]|nr:hypothetical protein [Arenicellales bacterium]